MKTSHSSVFPRRELCCFLVLALAGTVFFTTARGEQAPASGQTAGSPAYRWRHLSLQPVGRDRLAPENSGRSGFNLGQPHLNFILGGFDQGASLAGGAELTTGKWFRHFELRGTALASVYGYHLFEGQLFIPRLFDSRTRLDAWFAYERRYRDTFFGLGPRSEYTDKTSTGAEYRSLNLILQRELAPQIKAGIFFRYANRSSRRGTNGSYTPVDQMFSGNPAAVPPGRWVPGLLQTTAYCSYGFFAEWDRRDDTFPLIRGTYLYGRFLSHDGMDRPAGEFADFGWIETELDGRGYIPAGNKTSLAWRTLLDWRRPKGGSQIPYYEQSCAGGRMNLRGFNNYRFIAGSLLLFSLELRRVVWEKSGWLGIDAHLFGDLGQPWGDSRQPAGSINLANQRFSRDHWKSGLGGGVQFRLAKGLAFRTEIGFSHESSMVYFSFGTGF